MSDFLYNECQNILTVFKQSCCEDEQVCQCVLDALTYLRLACCDLDKREPTPEFDRVRAIFEQELKEWNSRKIYRSDEL